MQTVFSMSVMDTKNENQWRADIYVPLGIWTMTSSDFTYSLRPEDPVHIGDICFYVKHVWVMLADETHPEAYVEVQLKTVLVNPDYTPPLDNVSWWKYHYPWYTTPQIPHATEYLEAHGFVKIGTEVPVIAEEAESARREDTTFARYMKGRVEDGSD